MTQERPSAPHSTVTPRVAARDGILDRLSAAVYTTDRDGIITYYNAAAARLWGTEPIVGSSLWCGSFRIYNTDGSPLPHDQCPMAQCLKTGQGISLTEIIVERPDGAMCNVLVSPQPLLDESGAMIGAVNALADITDLREAETEQANYRDIVDSLLHHSDDCIKVLDADWVVRSINPKGAACIDPDNPRALVGQPYLSLFQEPERSIAQEALETARREGSARFRAALTATRDPDTIWDKRLSLIGEGKNHAAGYLVVSRDITRELRESEIKSRRLRQQETLSVIGELALHQGCFQQFMDRTVALVSQALAMPLVKILMFADQGDHLTLKAGVGWHDGLVGVARVGSGRESQAGYTLISAEPVVVRDLARETRFDGPKLLRDHGVRSGASVIIPGVAERPFGVLGVHSDRLQDIDDLDVRYLLSVANLVALCHRNDEAATRQALLVREIAHRAGNMLQFVGSIFNQTVRNSENLAEAKTKFETRLAQMSRANLLVSRDGWSKSNVRDLVANSLEPFIARMDLSGRDVMLPAELCFDIGLVLHELATNSAKYGVFADDGSSATVRLSWTIDPEPDQTQRFRLEWNDRVTRDLRVAGGTAGTAGTAGSGFGTRLIRQLAEAKWGGTVETTVSDGRFCCRLSFVLARELTQAAPGP